MGIFKKFISLLMVIALYALTGCGGDNSSGSASAPIVTGTTAEKGIFVDAVVYGLKYETPTHSGYTDKEGTFLYEKGETCKFWLGTLFLGEAKCGSLITPYTLAGDTDLSNPSAKATNIAMLLQNYDLDRSDTTTHDVSALQNYDFSGTNISLESNTSKMEEDINATLVDPSFAPYIDPDDTSLIDAETANGSMEDSVKEVTPAPILPPVDTNATTDAKALSIVGGNNIIVTGSGEKRDIFIMAFNSSGSTDTEGEITFQWPIEFIKNGTDFGSISPSKATISDGRVHFVYTAPSDLAAREAEGYPGVNFLFHSTTDADVNVTLSVDYNATGGYSSEDPILKTLTLEPKSIDVTANNYSKAMTLFAYTDQSTSNVNTNLLVKYPSNVLDNSIDIGYLPSGISVVNGKVNFNYNGPSDLANTIDKLNSAGIPNPIVLNIYDQTTGVNINLDLVFDLDAPRLRVEKPELILTNNAQKEIVTVLAFDKDNKAYESGTIYVQYPQSVIDKNISVGFFDNSEVAISGGKAIFNYTGPNPLETLADGHQSFTFRYKENSAVLPANLTVAYNPYGVINNFFILPSTVTVLHPEQTNEIKIVAVDANGVGVAADILIQQPILDGKDYGSFDTLSVTTDSTGIGILNFTAPKNIADLEKRVLLFKHLASDLEQNLTIVYENDIGSSTKTYDIEMSLEAFVPVDSSSLAGVKIVQRGTTAIIKSEDVKDVNVSTTYIDHLAFETASVNYKEKGEASIAFDTKNRSGIAMIDVSALIFDGVKDVVIQNSFPVVIHSGPIASMSMFLSKSELDANLNIYKDYFTINASDKYGNPVSAGTVIHPTLINGVKISSLDENGSGNLVIPNTFTDMDENLSLVTADDRLIVLPSEKVSEKEFFGSWDILSVDSDDNITLDNNVSTSSTQKLRYIVGNESRVINNVTTVATIQSPTGSYTTDSNGNLQFIVSYDPLLVGKKVYLSANSQSDNSRIGVAMESILKYNGQRLVADQSTLKVKDKYDSYYVDFDLLNEASVVVEEYPDIVVLNDLPSECGTIDLSYGLTIHSSLKYSAPDTFPANDCNFTVAFQGSTLITETISVEFNREAYTGFTMQALPSKLSIAEAKESKKIRVYLFDDAGEIATSESVKVDFFDPAKGTVSNNTLRTNSAGFVEFNFIAPDDIETLRNTSFDFNVSVPSEPKVYKTITVDYVYSSNAKDYSKYKLTS
ncbi:MAG: hypothetical protein DRG78_17625, partial [Epsilonproteobacteria bacterium]